LREQIKKLEAAARQLEPNADARAALLNNVAGYAEAFLQGLADAPAFVESVENGRSLLTTPISEAGIDIATALHSLQENVHTPGINPASPNFLGYIPGGGLYPAALGDYLAAIFNRYAGIFYASPGAVRLENQLLRWMADLIGYPDTMAGNLAAGGSIANLTAIVTAREAHHIQPTDIAKVVIYTTAQVHHSVDKAVRIAGLGTAVQRTIATDNQYRMDADALEQTIKQDKQAGLRPWLVIASAGTTNVGAVDPLTAVGHIAQQHSLWYHIDAAYGGFFVLCEEGRKMLAGMNTADSVVMDPHKTLFLPYGTGALLVKDRQKLYQSHQASAHYMQDALDAVEELSPADLSPELTKHFRGLRLWLPLKLFGVAPFRAALAEKIELARYFYHQIQTIDGFEVGPHPDLSVVTYRFVPKRGDADEFNRRLLQAVVADGRVFLSSTQLDGKFVLRLAISNFRTHLHAIDLALEILAEKAELLRNS
jgi:glutamate/tyrosine decarboxylase-like PLP-dependent enzyme